MRKGRRWGLRWLSLSAKVRRSTVHTSVRTRVGLPSEHRRASSSRVERKVTPSPVSTTCLTRQPAQYFSALFPSPPPILSLAFCVDLVACVAWSPSSPLPDAPTNGKSQDRNMPRKKRSVDCPVNSPLVRKKMCVGDDLLLS